MLTRYRVTVFWPGMGEVKARYYMTDIKKAVRTKQKHGEATICVWAGEKNGWQIATENAIIGAIECRCGARSQS